MYFVAPGTDADSVNTLCALDGIDNRENPVCSGFFFKNIPILNELLGFCIFFSIFSILFLS